MRLWLIDWNIHTTCPDNNAIWGLWPGSTLQCCWPSRPASRVILARHLTHWGWVTHQTDHSQAKQYLLGSLDLEQSVPSEPHPHPTPPTTPPSHQIRKSGHPCTYPDTCKILPFFKISRLYATKLFLTLRGCNWTWPTHSVSIATVWLRTHIHTTPTAIGPERRYGFQLKAGVLGDDEGG